MKLLAGSSRESTRFISRRLAVARGAWIVVAFVLAANFVASIPAYYMNLRTVCVSPGSLCSSWQPTPGNVVALRHLHLPVAAYAAYFVCVDVAVSLLFWIVGMLIFWRKSHEWTGVSVSLVLIIFGSFGSGDSLEATFRTSQTPLFVLIPIFLTGLLQWPAVGLFLLAFPTGRFAPRWSWLIVLLWIGQLGFFWATNFVPVLANFLPLVVFVTWGSTLGIQIYRYRRIYDVVQRQQVKWFMFALLAGLSLVVVGNGLLSELFAPLNAPDSWFQLLNGTFTAFLFASLPLGIGVAIFRYHLWDIDIIINRTLVYGSLTTLLALVYAGLIIGLQALLHGIIKQDNSVAIVISTLIIATLFQPLRRRLQKIIDRRFYRNKYDAAKIIKGFTATLRSEVDLTTLSEQLQDVVQETMQPTHVSLWLRPHAHSAEYQAVSISNPQE